MKKAKYVEPTDYFPKSLRKQFKLGEFDDSEKEQEKKEANKAIREFVNGKTDK